MRPLVINPKLIPVRLHQFLKGTYQMVRGFTEGTDYNTLINLFVAGSGWSVDVIVNRIGQIRLNDKYANMLIKEMSEKFRLAINEEDGSYLRNIRDILLDFPFVKIKDRLLRQLLYELLLWYSYDGKDSTQCIVEYENYDSNTGEYELKALLRFNLMNNFLPAKKVFQNYYLTNNAVPILLETNGQVSTFNVTKSRENNYIHLKVTGEPNYVELRTMYLGEGYQFHYWDRQ